MGFESIIQFISINLSGILGIISIVSFILNHNICGIRLDCGGEVLVFWPLSRLKFSYILLEFQKAVKQMTAKPIVDYFQRVCDATIMHVTWNPRC